ncbi:hypothetical protein E0Z10_g3980 [Xylaria hypoxylon]|uniref:CCHC-type domain-containing protein n=1 Tax=Xylaria hypoxylon TaxID=37992 RepID=A0A4Z0Z603_9PEZI|nr:hypothetical protein E0Z10_g3980 [Xylaria hypoxylon]
MSSNSGFRGGRRRRRRGGRGPAPNEASNIGANTGTNTFGRGSLTISGSNREVSQLIQQTHRNINRVLDRLPSHFNMNIVSQSSTPTTGQSNPTAPKGKKRSFADENPDPKKQKKGPKEPEQSPEPTHVKLEDRLGYETNSVSHLGTMRTSVVVSSRLASLASLRRSTLPPLPCKNCGQSGHIIDECPEKCAGCGEDGHIIDDCQSAGEICVCQAIPCHLLKDCGQNCDYCLYYSNDDEPHLARDCPVICHYCLVKGHTMADCEKAIPDPRECALCLKHGDGVKYHLPSQCIWNWCPNEQCKSHLGCVNHCKGCGWDDIQIDVLFLGREDTHKCQFRKFWAGNDDIGRPGIGLQCMHDKEHQFEHSELLAVRELAAKEMPAVLSQEGPVDKWPVECPTCRKNEENTPMA